MYTVHRSPHNPILSPDIEHAWEMVAFNPSPVIKDGRLHLFYRAQGRPDPLLHNLGMSTVGHVSSDDGVHFGSATQFVTPSEPWDEFGCEDPRTVYFEGRYYTFYTALGGIPFGPTNIKIGCAVSDDLETVAEKHLVTPFNSKAMALFPERVNGKIAVLLTAHTDEPPGRFGVALADRIEDLWDPAFWNAWHGEGFESRLLHIRRHGEDQMEVGAPPVLTKDGWLVVYSYISDYYTAGRTFGIEALLLDRNDPYRIIGRTESPIMVPEEAYELYGMVPDVVFPSGAIVEGDRLDIYYGAADTVCAKASMSLSDLIESMKPGARDRLIKRASENPILLPGEGWESRAVFNPGAIELNGKVHLLYRAMSQDNTSVCGYASSTDGMHFERSSTPAYVPRADFEMKRGDPNGNSGCEDARLTKIGDRIYICYTAYDGVHAPAVAIASIAEKDFLAQKWNAWSMPVLASPENTDDKDACLFPRTFDGKYLFFHRINGHICADYVDDLVFAKRVNRCIGVMGPRKGTWESEKVGIAGTPLETDAGWLMMYHAVSRDKHYALGAALLAKDDPTTVLARTMEPIFTVEEKYEKEGQIPNVVFCNGAVVRGDTLYIYYGGGDSVIGVATCSLSKLLGILTPRL